MRTGGNNILEPISNSHILALCIIIIEFEIGSNKIATGAGDIGNFWKPFPLGIGWNIWLIGAVIFSEPI